MCVVSTLALLASAPAAAADAGIARPAGRGGAYLLGAAYGAYAGGTVGFLLDEASERRERPTNAGAIALGGLLGSGAGLGTAALIGARQDPSPADVAALGSGMFVGGFVGTNVAAAFVPRGAPGWTERVQAAQLAGTLGGAGVPLLRGRPARSVGANLHLDLATVIGWQTAAGVSDMAGLDPWLDGQLRSGLALAGGLGFLGTAALAGPRLAPPAPATLAVALGDAAWLGAWAPFLFTDAPTGRQVGGGLRLGLGAGYLGALAIVGSGHQPSPRSAALQGIGAVAGNALGAGVPLAIGGEGPARRVVAPMLATGLAGQAAAALVAPRYALSDDDAYLVSALGSWTAYQSVGWAVFSRHAGAEPLQPLGYALTAGGAGTLLTLAAAPLLEVPPASTFQLVASGGWGSWYAGWGATLLDLERDEQWLATLAGGDAAILGAAVAEAAGLRPTWADVGIVNGAGALGAAAGGLVGLVALYDPDDWDPLVLSTLAGTTAGLGAGVVLAARDRGGSGDLALPTLDALDARPSLAVRPWADEQQRPGVYVELRLDEVR